MSANHYPECGGDIGCFVPWCRCHCHKTTAELPAELKAEVERLAVIAGNDAPTADPEPSDLRKQIENAVSYPLRQSEIADFRYEKMLDNLEELFNRLAGVGRVTHAPTTLEPVPGHPGWFRWRD